MLDILDYATKKLDVDKRLLDNGLGDRVDDTLKAHNALAYESYSAHRERLAEAERRVFDKISRARIYRWPVLLISLALLIKALPENSFLLIARDGFVEYVQQLSFSWFLLAAIIPVTLYFFISDQRSGSAVKVAAMRNAEWLHVRKDLLNSVDFQAYRKGLADSSSGLAEMVKEPCELNNTRLLFSDPKRFPYLIDQSFAKIRFTQTALGVKKIEALQLICVYFVIMSVAVLVLTLIVMGGLYFFGSVEPLSLTNSIATMLSLGAFSILALPNTDYNHLKQQLGRLYCDCWYHIDILEDCFGLDCSDAREEFRQLLQRDTRFETVDTVFFERTT